MATYTIQKGESGYREGRVCWYVMDGDFVIDVFDLKREAVVWIKNAMAAQAASATAAA